ncbi:MAG: hypothetical protein GXY55_21555 [Phycisphaerae bacterium]|nr:hypothetical protein [Phycisphaerae bacterium]
MAMSSKPVHEIRLGSVKAAIWANDTDSGVRHNVTVARLYREDDQWKTTSSFGRDDLPLLVKAVDQAHTWIFTESQNGRSRTKGRANGRSEDQ